MAGNVYANSGVLAGKRIADSKDSFEGIYVNEDVPETRVTGGQRGTMGSGLNTAGGRHYTLAAVCVLLLLCCLLLTAVTVLWIRFSTERNQSTQLQQERDELQTQSKQLQEERDELRNLSKQLQQERDELQDHSKQLQKERDELQKKLDVLDEQDKARWVNFGSRLYYFSEIKNWTEARQDCRERGADLVIIDSKEKQDFIVKQLHGRWFWIGLNDRETEGTWKWVDGTPLGTGYWTESQPDNYIDEEDCAEVGFPEAWGWNDRACSHKQGWMCEKSVGSV